MPTEEFKLRHENQLLKKLVVDLATLLKELIEHMDLSIQKLPQSRNAIKTARKLIETYGPEISTPDHRQ